ncbi:MAG: radical SAM protein [Deltaproteobacteria bacterium]|jgi:radical SAM superfamily enzyme YgiQ (UPF0313 family)|nr:radical SAM protein [Deltaproteobacteria bacterium]
MRAYRPGGRKAFLASERGALVKEPGGRVKIALIWPGTYRTGMSALGYLWVYGYLNSRSDTLAERFFWSEEPGQTARSVESNRKLDDFDFVAASMVLENDYWLLPLMVAEGGLNPERGQRNEGPLVAAGGIGVWSNPWPLWPFVDVFLTGEGEVSWPKLADLLTSCDFKIAGAHERLALISELVPGALVPALRPPESLFSTAPSGLASDFEAIGLSGYGRNSDGSERIDWPGPQSAQFEPVVPAFLNYPFEPALRPPVSPILSSLAEFSNTALVEISRGCPWGCRFCLAGALYRPHRPWPAETILAALEPYRRPGGRVGLISPAVADHPELGTILDVLYDDDLKVGLSSMRLSAVTEALALKLAKSGLTGLAVAPEGGSETIRAIINKNLSEAEILSSAKLLAAAGLRRLKLYFMLGLPGETDKDLEAMAELAALIYRQTRTGKKGPLVTVSAANFTPKPHTPLEDAPLLTESEMRRRGLLLTKLLKTKGPIELKLDPPKWTIIQGLLARGGPESADLVRALVKHRGRSGQALKEYGYQESDPAHRGGERSRPWRVIAPKAGTEYLQREKQLSKQAVLSLPCPAKRGCGRCQACPPGPAES